MRLIERFPAKYAPEVQAALREMKSRIERDDVASFMISEDATGHVEVHFLDAVSVEEEAA